jgi:ubiquinone/menaquinone biosynthesis C-methylase UbiE
MPVHKLVPPSVESTRDLYRDLVDARDNADLWHQYTHKQAEIYASTMIERCALSPDMIILNAGSAGNAIGIPHLRHVHVDLVESLLNNTASAFVADVQRLPFKDCVFDVVICIGAVLNYCDLARALGEMSRVLRPGGFLIIEYERSRSWEYLFTPTFNKNAAIVKTFYNGVDHPLWVYSDVYVESLLRTYDIQVRSRHYYHIVSPLVLRVTKSIFQARTATFLDSYVRHIPLLESMACNTIWSCSKKAAV